MHQLEVGEFWGVSRLEEGHPLSPQSGRPPSPAHAPCQQASRDFKIKMILVRLLFQ